LPARSNIWLYALVGVSCLLIGFAATNLAYRYRYLRPPGGSIIERMDRDLNLTPAQRDRIGDIMRDARFKVVQARRDYQHQRHQFFWQALSAVRGVLTPEQQQKFDHEFSRPWAAHDGDDDFEHRHEPPHEPVEPQGPAPK
jgi:Spy/CpxP family protein refolding chaperone